MTIPMLERWPIIGRRIHLDDFSDALDDPSVAGMVIRGVAGIGKTRLADECRLTAASEGHPVVRIAGSRAAAAVPLGALAHLLPSDLAGDEALDPYDRLADVLEERAAGARRASDRVVVMIDDLHLLDTTSLALLERALTDGLAFMLASVRSDDPAVTAVASWLARPGLAQVALDALERTDVDTLLHLALGGPVEGTTGAAFWDITHGNALYIRELALGALGSGALVDDGGVWHLRAPLTATNRLRELIEERVRATGPDGQRVLEHLAACGSAGRTELETLASAEVVDALERAGLVSIATDGKRVVVTVAHSLHAETIRQGTPRLTTRGLLRDAADRVQGYGARRRDDAVRIAIWRLDSDGRADPELLLAAARLARYSHDHLQVERLTEAILRAVPEHAEAGTLLGEARFELGRFTEAEQALAAAEAAASTDHERLGAAAFRAKNLFWGLLDPDAAMAVLDAARPRITDPDARDELLADRATDLAFSGHPREAVALLDELEGEVTQGSRTAVLCAIPGAPALVLLGQTTRAFDIATRGFEEHMALGDVFAIARPDTHIIAQVFALAHAGRLDEAEQLARAGHDIAVAEQVPIGQMWFALTLGMIHSLRGRPASSLAAYREARARARAAGFSGLLRIALTGCAMSAGQLGDVAGSGDAVRELDALDRRGQTFAFLADQVALGRAWHLVAAGDHPAASVQLVADGQHAFDSGDLASASWLWHDALRVNPDAPVTAGLLEIAAASESELFAARARHAEAVRAKDASALAAAADRFASLGSSLVAAEATLAAADAYRLAGEQRRANNLAEQADDLLMRCEDARTPRSVRAHTIVPLSKRERDIALLAARNVASKDIAERLSLSVRTVNNHLQRAYTKLAVSNRAELADALGLEDTAEP